MTFLVFRGVKWKKSSFVLFSLFNLSLIVAAINPNAVNFVRDMLFMQKSQYGRLIALLIVSSVFLLFYCFFTKAKLENICLQFDGLVRELGIIDFEKKYNSMQKIKPIMVVIPAYDEAESLKELLPRIPKKIEGMEVGTLVIDDGSEDATSVVAGQTDGVDVVRTPISRGGGAALRLGYDILGRSGTEICVTMDADGQHRPEEIERLVSPILDNEYDFIIGSRILGHSEDMSSLRFVGVYLFSFLINILLKSKITDPSSGFRAFKMDALRVVSLYEDQYHTSEFIIDATKKGMRIGEIPITVLKRKIGKSKKGNDWKYGVSFARAIMKSWWR